MGQSMAISYFPKDFQKNEWNDLASNWGLLSIVDTSDFLNGKANWQVQWQIVDATQSKVSYLHKFAPQKFDRFPPRIWHGTFYCMCSLLHPYKATKVLT